MCYSAQVVQLVKKIHREMGIRLDFDRALELFLRRLDDPGISVSRGFEANFDHPVTDIEHRIKAAIDQHRARAATTFERNLFAQKTRLVNAERSLREKETKKAREDVRIATNKIDALTLKLSDLRRRDPDDRDNRIFPMLYAGVIIEQSGEKLLTPMRYFCRPAGKPAFYDKKYPGLYNARRDNLEKFWGDQFGRHHAVMLVDSFYENVQLHSMQNRELGLGEEARNVVLQFSPQPPQTMMIACLWSHWTDAGQPEHHGFAAITDEPPADVAAAGHDRCIINLRPEHVDAWLRPQGRTAEELQAILSDRSIPVIAHEISQAA